MSIADNIMALAMLAIKARLHNNQKNE